MNFGIKIKKGDNNIEFVMDFLALKDVTMYVNKTTFNPTKGKKLSIKKGKILPLVILISHEILMSIYTLQLN